MQHFHSEALSDIFTDHHYLLMTIILIIFPSVHQHKKPATCSPFIFPEGPLTHILFLFPSLRVSSTPLSTPWPSTCYLVLGYIYKFSSAIAAISAVTIIFFFLFPCSSSRQKGGFPGCVFIKVMIPLSNNSIHVCTLVVVAAIPIIPVLLVNIHRHDQIWYIVNTHRRIGEV